MRRVGASFLAMTAGWVVMNLVVVPVFALLMGSPPREAFGAVVLYGFFSSFVVAAAWLIVYLPIYSFVPTGSAFWHWGVCVPAGFLIGALAPVAFNAILGGGIWAPFAGLAAVVGVVAAAVGRWLYPWSRHYEMESWVAGEGRRIPWLRT